MPRSPCPGNSMLGQRYQPFSFLQTCTWISSLPALFWTTSRLGWHRPDNPTGPTHLVRIILDKRFPYMDARSHCPMDRTDWKACQQRSSPTRQHPTGLPEIHILQKSDARQPVPLLFGWSGAYLTEQCHPQMSEMGLLNLDEFDKYSSGKIPLLKTWCKWRI